MKKQIPYLIFLLLLISYSCGPNFYFVIREKEEIKPDTVRTVINYPESHNSIPPAVFKPNPGISCKALHIGYYYDPMTGRYKSFTYSCGEVNFNYPYVISSHQYKEMHQR